MPASTLVVSASASASPSPSPATDLPSLATASYATASSSLASASTSPYTALNSSRFTNVAALIKPQHLRPKRRRVNV
ncbi:unnamed protein product [Linum trigynum]|uniref:Uncharacterized protein n=1 Tax=Linum trigynum TaxID=586398 RepID=A0AAV2EB28_9ROSI